MVERSPGRRWVVVADSPFLPARGGGEREHLGFCQAAARAGVLAAVVVPADDDPGRHGRDDDLAAIADLVAPAPVLVTPRRRGWHRAFRARPYVVSSRPTPPGLVPEVRRAAPDVDAVIVYSYKSTGIGRSLAEGLQVPAVVRQHNLEGAYHRALADSARGPRAWLTGWEAGRIDRDERRLEHARWVTGIADISRADAEVRARRSSVPVRYVPTFALGPRPEIEQPAWTPPDEPVVTFLGSLDVATNQDAVRWFAQQVWPRIQAAVPRARWSVVGRRPGSTIRSLLAGVPGAELHADVDDPSTRLRSSSVAINPAVSGSGVNIKLVEYLAVGVPVVSTSRGAAGLGLCGGRDLLLADEPDRFARTVVGLVTDPARSARLGATGRTTLERLTDVEQSLAVVSTLLDGPPSAAPDGEVAATWPGDAPGSATRSRTCSGGRASSLE